MVVWKLIDLERISFKETLDDVMLHYGNFWDIQMALRTDPFVNRTFRESNWTVGERLLVSDQSQFDNTG